MKLQNFFDNLQLKNRIRNVLNDDSYKDNSNSSNLKEVKVNIANIKTKYGYYNNFVNNSYKEHIEELKKKYLNDRTFQLERRDKITILKSNKNNIKSSTWQKENFFLERQQSMFYRTLSVPKLKDVLSNINKDNDSKVSSERNNKEISLSRYQSKEIENILPISKRIIALKKYRRDIDNKVNNKKEQNVNKGHFDKQIEQTVQEIFFPNKCPITPRYNLYNIKRFTKKPRLLSYSPKPKINPMDFNSI